MLSGNDQKKTNICYVNFISGCPLCFHLQINFCYAKPPLNGLVQIPCIERNVHAAARAFDSARYSILSDGKHFISFDVATKVMKETGKDIPSLYRETALGGLAVFGDKDFVDN